MYNYRTLFRDALVDDATVKGYFNAAATGSCRVNMENLNVSGKYPQIIISYDGGQTTSNMDGDEATMSLTIESKGSGTLHPHKELGQIRSAILGVVDDTNLSGTSTCYLSRKFGELYGYDDSRGVHWLRLDFNCYFKQNTSIP